MRDTFKLSDERYTSIGIFTSMFTRYKITDSVMHNSDFIQVRWLMQIGLFFKLKGNYVVISLPVTERIIVLSINFWFVKDSRKLAW